MTVLIDWDAITADSRRALRELTLRDVDRTAGLEVNSWTLDPARMNNHQPILHTAACHHARRSLGEGQRLPLPGLMLDSIYEREMFAMRLDLPARIGFCQHCILEKIK